MALECIEPLLTDPRLTAMVQDHGDLRQLLHKLRYAVHLLMSDRDLEVQVELT